MQHLAVDIGNTRIKAGIFSDRQLIKLYEDVTLEQLPKISSEEKVARTVVCSVGYAFKDVESITGLSDLLNLSPGTKIPIKNCYHTPETLGMDRLAAAIGANQLYPQTDCLVIDAGTTITYDFVDRNGNYMGGGISPGVRIRFKSLNQHTSRLPFIEQQSLDIPLIGKDTAGSILSGVINGVQAEIEGIIRRYEHKFPTLTVILCGGDAGLFEGKLEASIFMVPHLVLIGLNSVLIYHAQNS
jgi:type III pantothenate kinase